MGSNDHPINTIQYSLLIEKDICDRQNVSIKFPCVCVCLLSGDLFTFSVRDSFFFSYFLCYGEGNYKRKGDVKIGFEKGDDSYQLTVKMYAEIF